MTKQLSPKITVIILAVVLAVAVGLLWKSTDTGARLPVGTTQPGNKGPFSPGGEALMGSGGNPFNSKDKKGAAPPNGQSKGISAPTKQ